MGVEINKDIISVCPTCGEEYADGNVEKLRNDLQIICDANKEMADNLRRERDELQDKVYHATREHEELKLGAKVIVETMAGQIEMAKKDRDYYKKAKTENDERFQLESGELRRERDDYREALKEITKTLHQYDHKDGERGTEWDMRDIGRNILAKYPMHDAKK